MLNTCFSSVLNFLFPPQCLQCGGRVPDALKRVRATAQQTGLTRKEREQNVRNAFAVNPRFAGRIKNARVLLVDDVYTTGATLTACTEALLEAGAGNVCVLTLARRV